MAAAARARDSACACRTGAERDGRPRRARIGLGVTSLRYEELPDEPDEPDDFESLELDEVVDDDDSDFVSPPPPFFGVDE